MAAGSSGPFVELVELESPRVRLVAVRVEQVVALVLAQHRTPAGRGVGLPSGEALELLQGREARTRAPLLPAAAVGEPDLPSHAGAGAADGGRAASAPGRGRGKREREQKRESGSPQGFG